MADIRKLKKYKPTRFMAKGSAYNRELADLAVSFIGCLKHTKGEWYGQNFELIDWQEQIIRDLFGIVKPNGYRQFNTAYIEIAKKQGKSELAAAVAREMLQKGIINETDFLRIEARLAAKFQPVLGGIFC